MIKPLIVMLISFFCSLGLAQVTDFQTDACTLFPEGTPGRRDLWRHCCVEHDLYFWAGGSKGDRKEADQRLKDCVAKTGARQFARLIYLGVRSGQYSPYHIKEKKWGNAWDGRVSYQALSEQETNEIIDSLNLQRPPLPDGVEENFKTELFGRLENYCPSGAR